MRERPGGVHVRIGSVAARCAVGVLVALPLVLQGELGRTASAVFPGKEGRIVLQRAQPGGSELAPSNLYLFRLHSGADFAEARAAPGSRARTGKFVFSRYEGNGAPDLIFVAGSDGSGLRRLAGALGGHPAWSPDGRRVAYDKTLEGIWVVNADGSGKRRISDTKCGGLDERPRWSPDGKRIVFEGGTGACPGQGFRIMNADGSHRKLVRLSLRADDPDWSRDGKRIAFSSYDRTDGKAIYVVNLDGRGLRQVTHPSKRVYDSDVRWSPDGKTLLFIRQGPRGEGLYTVRASGGAVKLVRPGFLTSGAWSPDGKQIAYPGRLFHIVDLARRTDRILKLRPCGVGACLHLDWQDFDTAK